MSKKKPTLKVKPVEESQEVECIDVNGQIQQLTTELHKAVSSLLADKLQFIREKLELTETEAGEEAFKIDGKDAQDNATILIAAPIEALIACFYDFIKPTVLASTEDAPLFFYVRDRLDYMLERAVLASLESLAQYDEKEAKRLFEVFASSGTIKQQTKEEQGKIY